MADPVLDELVLVAMLSYPPSLHTLDALQSGALHTIVDMYDRKVTRDEFCKGLSSCVSLYGQAAKYWMLHNIKEEFDAGTLAKEMFEEGDVRYLNRITEMAGTVLKLVKLLQQCPTTQDPVH